MRIIRPEFATVEVHSEEKNVGFEKALNATRQNRESKLKAQEFLPPGFLHHWLMSRTRTNFAYPKNVRFQCTRCALCCGDTETRARHVLMLKREAERISETTSRPVEDFACRTEGYEPYAYEMRKSISGRCIFLEKDKCFIYASRPLVCRYYPFELRTLGSGRLVFSSTKECPGMGGGKLLRRVYFEELFQLARDQIG